MVQKIAMIKDRGPTSPQLRIGQRFRVKVTMAAARKESSSWPAIKSVIRGPVLPRKKEQFTENLPAGSRPHGS